jgi:hypothetical protein
MQADTTTTFTAAAALKIKGAKGLKTYTDAATATIQSIRQVFQDDASKPNANVDEPSICRRRIQYLAQICAMDHRTFVHNITLCSPSELVHTEAAAVACLDHLEKTRKMFVNNKQQQKTTIRHIRGIIRQGIVATMTTTPPALHELEHETPMTKELNQLIERVKQNHKTTSNKILEQARFNMEQMRRCILAFQLAAENTIQKIIDHAEKCRAFIAQSRHLAVIEYCASAWWFETQKDAMDPFYYYVTAVDLNQPAEVNGATLHRYIHETRAGLHGTASSSSSIRIVVEGAATREHPETPIVAVYDLAELEDTILTEEALLSFETEQGQIWDNNTERESWFSEIRERQAREEQQQQQQAAGWGAYTEQHDDDDDEEDSESEEMNE